MNLDNVQPAIENMALEFCNFIASSSGISCPSFESRHRDYKDLPYTIEAVWILGYKYNCLHDLDEIRRAIRSKIWCSYRLKFPPIGGTGPSSDKHWGCMLRCGQMVMAEAMVRRHLGRGWIWEPAANDPVYIKILKMFQDRKDCPFSIHQIAQMGVSEGKSIGQWFGPNTVAQVLRKLSVYDEWSSIVVHIALDNAVIVNDIRKLCQHTSQPMSLKRPNHNLPIVKDPNEIYQSLRKKLKWRPMLLFIPLRLGLSDLNPVYIRSLITTFTLRQSLGIIGGKPSHALWFIGCVGNELIYLDPHTTQPAVNLDLKEDDSSFHINYGRSKRMSVAEIDPSISLCFYFDSEEDFDHWCMNVKNQLMPQNPALFEIAEDRPDHWPPLEMSPDEQSNVPNSEYCFVERERRLDDSDDDFEIFDPIFPSQTQPTQPSTSANSIKNN